MKLFGSLSELAAILFRKNGFSVTARPNQTTTYTANRDVQVPPGDADQVLVSEAATQTLTNKSLTSPAISSPTGLVKADVGLGNVDNTSDATKNSATATLTNKTLTAPVINSPTGITKADVGLSNVDNTSDATKDAAVATLTNKTLTAPVINSPTGLVKADVGLSNVDNTSDATKNSAAATLTNKTLTAPVISNYEDLTEITTPANPSAGTLRIYAKTNDTMYTLNSSGVETQLGTGGGGTTTANVRATEGAGTVTLTVSDNPYQVFDITGTVLCRLPTTGIQAGEVWTIENKNQQLLYVQASDTATITTINSAKATLVALINTPVTGTDWALVSTTPNADARYMARVTLSSGSGPGSTNTAIATFTTVSENVGTDLTISQSGTAGDSVTINQDGLYEISHTNTYTTDRWVGISLNSSQLSTSISGITPADILAITTIPANTIGTVTITAFLQVNDVVRPHSENAVNSGAADKSKFSVRRVM